MKCRLRSERGVGLIELLTVLPMLAIVLMGIYALSNIGAKSQRQTHARTSTLQRAQSGMERLTREMRQATAFTPVSSQILDATTYVRPAGEDTSVPRRVRYECTSGSCKRWEGAVGSSLDTGPETVISGLQNADVFFFSPDSVNPNFVSMKVEVSVNGATNPIVLDGGFELRNMEAH
jgi:Tfp pilus assembly protein PilX